MRLTLNGTVPLCAALAATLLSGCANEKKADVQQRPEIDLRPGFAQGGDPTVVAVRRITTIEGTLVGYLKVRETPGETRTKGDPKPIVKKPFRINWVYDPYWKPRGFYTDEGGTFILDREGEIQERGRHNVDDAKTIILGHKERMRLELRPIEAPRTLDGDRAREAEEKVAREAAAKLAADKASGEGGETPAPEGGGS